MGAFIDLTGKRFSRLLVIKRVGSVNRTALWECICDCGKITNVRGKYLKSGHTKSCSCIRDENTKTGYMNRKHGMSNTRIHISWRNMVSRCTDPRAEHYKDYGGRGITVCDKWLTFGGFFEDMKESYSDELTLERIDNEKGYSKENCKWATRQEQAINKRDTAFVEFNGKREKLAGLFEKFKIKSSVYYGRRRLGWSVEKALMSPLRKMKKRAN